MIRLSRCVRSLGLWMMLVIVFIPLSSSNQEPRVSDRHEAYMAVLREIEAERESLFKSFERAQGIKAKNAIRQAARHYVTTVIVDEIIPRWVGVPWTMAVVDDGLKPNAKYPFEKGKGISCSWFLVSVLRSVGLKFINKSDFAGTISIHFQYAMSPRKRDIHRYFNTTPKKLKKKLISLGDGLYVVGLNYHIGFVHVRGDKVNFIHSSCFPPQTVVIEPLTESIAIAFSEEEGYVVSPLFQDTRLIDMWLSGRRVPFQKYPMEKKR